MSQHIPKRLSLHIHKTINGMQIIQRSFLTLFCLFFFFFGSALKAQDRQAATQILSTRGEFCFSFGFDSKSQLSAIGKHISIDKIVGNKAFAYANAKGFDYFLSLNIPWTLEKSPAEKATGIKMSDFNTKEVAVWDAYPTYAAYKTMMLQFQTSYPNFCKIDTILNATPGGKQILVAKITKNVNTPADKPQFLYTSSMHGDETTGYILMLRLIDYLLTNYGTNARVTNLLDNVEIWINPLANPDGTYNGSNTSVANAKRYNSNNVDLNRNYPDPVGGAHSDGEVWQPETEAFMAFAAAHHFVMSANFHGGIELANYVWDSKYDLNADNNWWLDVSKEYADTCKKASANNGYFTGTGDGIYPGVTNGAGWYLVYGGRQDYMNYWHHCREFTLEISDEKLLTASQLPAHWDYNYLSLLNYMQQSLYGFRGIVTDSVTSQPIRAKITVVGHDMDSTEVYSALPVGNYHRPIKAGTWTLKFEAPGYCPQTISNVAISDKQTIRFDVKMVACPTSIDSYTNNQPLEIYPNPTTGNLNIRSEGNPIQSILVYDLSGKLLFSKQGLDEDQLSMDLSSFSNGIYRVNILTKSGLSVRKIVISQ
jgi:hypothetical protein